ncbi:hypothetical protein T484DRAFT_1821961 [Baffinella frigidus]|nr:hypothetical protein T484DRAFT_1821961 [Cryptophyta sp. CCMP2293]
MRLPEEVLGRVEKETARAAALEKSVGMVQEELEGARKLLEKEGLTVADLEKRLRQATHDKDAALIEAYA